MIYVYLVFKKFKNLFHFLFSLPRGMRTWTWQSVICPQHYSSLGADESIFVLFLCCFKSTDVSFHPNIRLCYFSVFLKYIRVWHNCWAHNTPFAVECIDDCYRWNGDIEVVLGHVFRFWDMEYAGFVRQNDGLRRRIYGKDDFLRVMEICTCRGLSSKHNSLGIIK